MCTVIKVLWCSLFLIYLQESHADYANSTISKVRMISDDFRIFQKTGKRISRRDGRRLISFDTRNNNIEVHLQMCFEYN